VNFYDIEAKIRNDDIQMNFIALSSGDINGIGPEVILKSIPVLQKHSIYKPVLFCHKSIIEEYVTHINWVLPFEINEIADVSEWQEKKINCIAPQTEVIPIELGHISASSGKYAMASIKSATESVLSGATKAIVTAPISKEAIHLAGFSVPGHTEYLAELCGNEKSPLMVLATETLRVALTTIHVPLHKISELITFENVEHACRDFYQSLRQDFGVLNPRLALLGLNPHAGDGGVLGREELEIIAPVIKKLNEEGFLISGPFAADGFFGSKQWKQYDGVLAMYHDQGLIPFKTIAFHDGVNITCNLPIVRTSPDHGTGFSIAGKNLADPQSFQEAYKTAQTIISNRGIYLKSIATIS